MANLYLDVYSARTCLSQSVRSLRRIEQVVLSDCFGFIPQGLRDTSR